jgi:hypothetical protein
MDYQEWFEKYGHSHAVEDIGLHYAHCATAEEMYQAFKARMISELRVTSDEFLNFAELRDISQ